MKVHYRELTPTEFRHRLAESPIAYLPLGTLEWHGEHLPLGADGLQSEGFMTRLAQRVGGIVLPMLFLGPDRRQIESEKTYYGRDISSFKGKAPQQLDGSAYWVSDELFARILEAILTQLRRSGFRIVVAHGHGPSGHAFRDHAEHWQRELDLELFTCWRDDEHEVRDGLGLMIDHAGANETSLMMAMHPGLVQMGNLPSDLDEWPLGIGGQDPRVHASAEAGEQIIALQLDRLATMLRAQLKQLSH